MRCIISVINMKLIWKTTQHITERLKYFAASYIRKDEAPANLAKILACEWKLVYCKWTFCNICILPVIVETVIKFWETMYLQYRQVKMKNRRVEIWNMHVDTLSFFFVINSRLYSKMKEQIIYIFLIFSSFQKPICNTRFAY